MEDAVVVVNLSGKMQISGALKWNKIHLSSRWVEMTARFLKLLLFILSLMKAFAWIILTKKDDSYVSNYADIKRIELRATFKLTIIEIRPPPSNFCYPINRSEQQWMGR